MVPGAFLLRPLTSGQRGSADDQRRPGNPAGRPPGSANASLLLLRDAADEILPLVIKRAKDVDADAQRLILDWALPRLRPVTSAE